MRIQAEGGTTQEGMDALIASRGVDPEALAQAGMVLTAMHVTMKTAPEDAVVSAFITGAVLGLTLAPAPPTVGDLQPD